MEEQAKPVAGEDYPRTFQEFETWFSDEASCHSYLLQLRWPDGFRCPRCGCVALSWVTARGYMHCQNCESEISVTAGTILERTHSPLRTWLLAMWFVASQKQGEFESTTRIGPEDVVAFLNRWKPQGGG